MIVKLKGAWVDIPIVSVWLKVDPIDPFRLKMFFCPNCQTPVLQYNGVVTTILPGVTPTDIPKVIECHNGACRVKYMFIDKV